MTNGWHIHRDGTTYGPYPWPDLVSFARTGHLAPTDLVWSQSLSEWTSAHRISGLWPTLQTPPLTNSAPAPAMASAPAAPKSIACPSPSAPQRRRSTLPFVLVLVALVAVSGGALCWLWLKDGDAAKKQSSLPGTLTSEGLAPVTDDAFWRSDALQAAVAAMDGGEWRSYPDVAAEQEAIGVTLSAFSAAMQAGDLDLAESQIHPERQEAYRQLFAANPEGMASFGALVNQAAMSFLSEHDDTTANSRTAEYTLDLDGVKFYLLLIKTADGWFLYDL